MPGRKKKKASANQMPPLVFDNSPVYQPAPMLEVDMAALNPVTARPVAVDELSETMWVSPQFKRLSAFTSCRVTRSCSKLPPQLTLGGLKPSRRFRPLRLLNETISRAAPFESAVGDNNLPAFRLQNEECQKESLNTLNPPSNITDLQGLKIQNLPLSHARDANQSHRGICQELNDFDQGDQVVLHKICTGENKRTSSERIIPKAAPVLCLACAALDKTYPDKKCYKHSLRHNNSGCASTSKPACSLKEKISFADQDKISQSPSKQQHVIFHLNAPNFSISPQTPTQTTHGKLDSHTTPRKSSADAKSLLVLDTPECDYGLSFRERQLKYGVTGARSKDHTL